MLKPNSQKIKIQIMKLQKKRNLKWQLQKIVRCLKAHSEQKIINLKYQSNHNSKGRRIKKVTKIIGLSFWNLLKEVKAFKNSDSFGLDTIFGMAAMPFLCSG